MEKELKRQLILSGILICLLLSTLFLWYNNFVFHTYLNVADYQYCFAGENEKVAIDGYEIYKHDYIQKNGNARIMSLEDRFFLKGDVVETIFMFATKSENYRFEQQTRIQTDNEVFTLNELETVDQLDEEVKNAELKITIKRGQKVVYNETIEMKSQDMTVYNGGNKDYAIHNAYATSSWLKTGDLSTSLPDIDKKYPRVTMDYMYLRDGGDANNIDDYERFAYIQGKTAEILKGETWKVAYYDEQDSLLSRTLVCVVTLMKADSQENAYTFMVPLQGTIKVVETSE